jgi:hypothetical protein
MLESLRPWLSFLWLYRAAVTNAVKGFCFFKPDIYTTYNALLLMLVPDARSCYH